MIGMLARLGRWARHVINDLGFAGRFLMQLLWASLLSLKRPRLISEQVYFVGNRSLSIILISGLFVGFVLGLQGYYNLERYGAESSLGLLVALSLLRGNWFYFPSLGWRADAITQTGFRQGLNVVQDMALVLDIAMNGGALFYDKTLAFMYRRHGGSDSSWRALEGTRFDEERTYFTTIAAELEALGWKKAAKAARIRFSSRAHALTLLPKAALAKKWRGVKNLAVHVVK